jgi:hypothetical protein
MRGRRVEAKSPAAGRFGPERRLRSVTAVMISASTELAASGHRAPPALHVLLVAAVLAVVLAVYLLRRRRRSGGRGPSDPGGLA